MTQHIIDTVDEEIDREQYYDRIEKTSAILPVNSPEIVIEDACRVLCNYKVSYQLGGRSIEEWVAASLLVSSRWHDVPIPASTIANSSYVTSKREIHQASKTLTKGLEINVQGPVEVSEVIEDTYNIVGDNFVDSLNSVQQKTFLEECRAKAEVVEQELNVVGRNPWGMAASIIYLVGEECGVTPSDLTQRDISNSMGISRALVRDQLQEIRGIYA